MTPCASHDLVVQEPGIERDGVVARVVQLYVLEGDGGEVVFLQLGEEGEGVVWVVEFGGVLGEELGGLREGDVGEVSGELGGCVGGAGGCCGHWCVLSNGSSDGAEGTVSVGSQAR